MADFILVLGIVGIFCLILVIGYSAFICFMFLVYKLSGGKMKLCKYFELW